VSRPVALTYLAPGIQAEIDLGALHVSPVEQPAELVAQRQQARHLVRRGGA